MPAHRFSKLQKRHFFLTVLLPFCLSLSGPLWLPSGWLSWKWATLAVVMWWIVGCLGISVGFHRLYAHRSFKVSSRIKYLLGAFGSMAAQGSALYWVALHRCHHSLSDKFGDPHSPSIDARPDSSKLRAFWIGHVGWTWRHDVPKPARYAADLVVESNTQALGRQYWMWVGLGILIPAVAGAAIEGTTDGFIIGGWWGGVLRIALGHQIIWAVNSVCHTFGRRPTNTADNSGNNAWLSLISWGESWHNNHHASPTSARLGWYPHQFDIGWLCIRLMHILGLATEIRHPNRP
jgi:stearoyl-CoA desaturase (Delta-9 desaturase)